MQKCHEPHAAEDKYTGSRRLREGE
jgi:hypothetical protein